MVDARFFPDRWQAELLRSRADRSLLLCARQVGKSLCVSMLALHTALTQPGSTTTVVAPVEEQANELLRKVITAYYRIGSPVGVIREAVTRLELANGSRVIALPGKEARMRSYSSALLVIDEAARVPDEVMNAAGPTLAATKGRLVALSTAFAKSGWFYKEWTGPESYNRVSVRACDCPRIDPAFLAAERRRLGARWFDMEFNNIFGDAVASVFPSEFVDGAVSESVLPLFGASPAAAPSGPAPAGDPWVRPLFAAG